MRLRLPNAPLRGLILLASLSFGLAPVSRGADPEPEPAPVPGPDPIAVMSASKLAAEDVGALDVTKVREFVSTTILQDKRLKKLYEDQAKVDALILAILEQLPEAQKAFANAKGAGARGMTRRGSDSPPDPGLKDGAIATTETDFKQEGRGAAIGALENGDRLLFEGTGSEKAVKDKAARRKRLEEWVGGQDIDNKSFMSILKEKAKSNPELIPARLDGEQLDAIKSLIPTAMNQNQEGLANVEPLADQPLLADNKENLAKARELIVKIDRVLARTILTRPDNTEYLPSPAERVPLLMNWVKGEPPFADDPYFLKTFMKGLAGHEVNALDPKDEAALQPLIKGITQANTAAVTAGEAPAASGAGAGQVLGTIAGEAFNAFLDTTPIGAYSSLATDVVEAIEMIDLPRFGGLFRDCHLGTGARYVRPARTERYLIVD